MLPITDLQDVAFLSLVSMHFVVLSVLQHSVDLTVCVSVAVLAMIPATKTDTPKINGENIIVDKCLL